MGSTSSFRCTSKLPGSSGSPNFRQKRTWLTLVQQKSEGQSFNEKIRDTLGAAKKQLSRLSARDRNALVDLIKTCGECKDLHRARSLHAYVLQKELIPTDIYVTTALISTYSKCGNFREAQKLFDDLPLRNVVSWNALVSGYGQYGLGIEALSCFTQMRDDGISPNVVTFTCMLKACSNVECLEIGEEIRAEASKQEFLEKDVVFGNTLVDMYAKCGELIKAQEVFDEMPVRDVVTWNSIITAYVRHGLSDEAFNCFKHMRSDCILPDAITLTSMLKACGSTGSLEIGKAIHAEAIRQGLLGKNLVLGNTLVDMYTKCGDLGKARDVFDEMPVRDVVSWNALIAGYALHDFNAEALNCFRSMQDNNISPNEVTCTCILKACGAIGSPEMRDEIYAEASKQGLLGKSIVVGSTLVDTYAKCGELGKAQEVFDGMPVRDVVSWNALIGGYVQHGHYVEALACFKKMQDDVVSPDAVTFTCILKACSNIGSLAIGEEIHVKANKQDFVEKDIVLGSALVDMYAKCGELDKAREVFDEMAMRNVITWNALISGYAQYGLNVEALNCFSQMQGDGVSPDAVTFTCVSKACGSIGSLEMGKRIHAEASKLCLLEKNIELGSTFVGMYAKCGELGKAKEVFDEMPKQDVMSWNALIGGYAQCSLAIEALDCFRQMQDDCIPPDEVTFTCILKACGCVGALEIGEEIHAEASRQGLLEANIVLGSSLMDMYANCGEPGKAQEIFDEMQVQDVVSWNTLLSGYAQQGEAKRVFDLFGKMIVENIVPNLVTFVVILTACSHAAFVEEGQKVFDDMSVIYYLTPTLEHYTCLMDLLSRAGCFDKAIILLKNASFCDHLLLFLGLLGACRKWVDIGVGRWAFEHSFQLDEKCAATYVCMGNIWYAC